MCSIYVMFHNIVLADLGTGHILGSRCFNQEVFEGSWPRYLRGAISP